MRPSNNASKTKKHTRSDDRLANLWVSCGSVALPFRRTDKHVSRLKIQKRKDKFRDAVNLLLAGQKVRPEYESRTPDVMDSEGGEEFQVVSMQPLIEMKLNLFRDKDRTHLRDMLEIGLINQSWTTKVSPKLAARLQTLACPNDRATKHSIFSYRRRTFFERQPQYLRPERQTIGCPLRSRRELRSWGGREPCHTA